MKTLVLMFVQLAFVGSILVACAFSKTQGASPVLKPTATAFINEASETLPDYIYDVWPASGQIVNEGRNIGWLAELLEPCDVAISVKIWPDKIYTAKYLAENERDASKTVLEYMTLTVNGLSVPNSTMEIRSWINGGIYIDEAGNKQIYDAGPYEYRWLLALCAGVYDALIEIRDFDDNLLSFSWSFTVASE